MVIRKRAASALTSRVLASGALVSGVLASGVLASLLLIAAPVAAAEKVSQEHPSADACSKTIGAMGASMGHSAAVAPDGRPIYNFVLRTNGVDYDAVCDARTGMVKDVTRRVGH